MAETSRILAGSKTRSPTPSGLRRERVLLTLDQVRNHRLTLVLAPPGTGKTTALAQYKSTMDAPTAWYRAEATDGQADTMIAYVARAIGEAIGEPVEADAGVIGLVSALEAWRGSLVLLVVDDLHTLEGTDAERELERLLDLAPPSLRILAAARRAPLFNLPRLRLNGDLLEVDGADLRFRSWEVEQLFTSVYREPLPPEELATLSRRTEGWAAGLQLFHLATTGKSVVVRRRAVASLAAESRLVRGYLTQNVLEDIPRDLRAFLVETSVLGRLTPSLCDRLRGDSGSLELLAEATRRQLFLVPLEDTEAYRVHEVLRSYLEVLLVAEVGSEEARRRYARAGWLLEGAHALPEALLAYSRAGLSTDVRRMLGDLGERLGAEPGSWLEMLPAEMSEHDPWLVLAQARRAAADGRLAAAAEAYRRAEEQFGSSPPAEECRRARGVIALWAEGSSLPSTHWAEPLRAALQRNPAAAIQDLSPADPPEQQLVQALVRLLYGHLPEARRTFESLSDHPLSDAWLQTAAELAAAVSVLMEGRSPSASALLPTARRAEDSDLPWLARLARALAAAATEPPRPAELEAIRKTCDGLGDRWGSGLVSLIGAMAALRGGADPRPAAAIAERGLHELGATVLAAVAVGVAAVGAARLGEIGDDLPARARAAGRSVGSRWPQLLAALASGCDHEFQALAVECGVAPESVRTAMLGGSVGKQVATPLGQVKCLGSFSVRGPLGEVRLLSGLKPRCQELLRLLCARPGQLVHRDELVAALWPQSDNASGLHNLHVAVSSLRRFFLAAVGDSNVIAREFSGYRIAAPERIGVDVLVFTDAVAQGRRSADVTVRLARLQQAVSMYGGDLLPGTTGDWVSEAREALRTQAADAASALGELFLAEGRPREAAQSCRFGLRADRYRDDLWRLLIESLTRCQDPAARAKAELRYREVLDDLGVPVSLIAR